VSTKIEWTDETWNPVTGCTKVSPGCDHCYAEGIAHRFAGTQAYPNGFDVTLRPERLEQPLRWTRPRMVFVNSMSDLFHRDIPDEYIARVFAVMALAPQHTFQILTKRHGRMKALLSDRWWSETLLPELIYELAAGRGYEVRYPLPNVWLGVSAEDNRWGHVRIPALLRTPAAVRFVSAEPLLGPLRLYRYLPNGFGEGCRWNPRPSSLPLPAVPTLDWVIVGGESGPGARPMQPEWVRDIRRDCETSEVPFFFKQWGNHAPRCTLALCGEPCSCDGANPTHPVEMRRMGKPAAGRLLDGREHTAWPQGATA
jgi:protein gp37